jgi:hypothetical protein
MTEQEKNRVRDYQNAVNNNRKSYNPYDMANSVGLGGSNPLIEKYYQDAVKRFSKKEPIIEDAEFEIIEPKQIENEK